MADDPTRHASIEDAQADRPTSSASLVWRLGVAFVHFARWRIATVVLLTLGLTVTAGAGLVMLVPLLGVAGLDVGSGSIGRLAELASRGLALVGLTPTVPVVIGVYLAVVAASAVLKREATVRSARLYEDYVMTLRRDAYRAVTDANWRFFARQRSSRFLHMLTRETQRVGSAASSLVNLAVRFALTGVYLALALVVSFWTTLLVLACGGVLALLLARKTRAGREHGEAVSEAYEGFYEALSEHVAGMRVTKSHGLEAQHVRVFADRTRDTAGSSTAVVRNQADVSFWLELGSATILAGIFYVALVGVGLPVASILLLLYLFARLVPMVTGLQKGVHRLLDVLPSVERLGRFMDRMRAEAEPPTAPEGAPAFREAIRLEGVTFAYGGSDDEVTVHDVDLTVPSGETTAIVGASGAGKSTVADLIAGLVRPDTGTVMIDGVPLDHASARAWRRRVGYVSQDSFLFHATIRENLLLVAPDASEGDMEAALHAAAADFVASLPDGLDTVVGDRGARLSGGERQRIALARALLRRPELLILDEATSALDAENENAIQEAIERMAGRQTILMITHRLGSVRGADRLYVMDEGQIVESGTWEQLVRDRHGRLYALGRAQGLLAVPSAS